LAETLYKSENVTVTLEDLGLDSLSTRLKLGLIGVLEKMARDVEGRMKSNIIQRGFFDTGATTNSVAVSNAGELQRDIGPATEYAIYGELGWTRTEKNGRETYFAGLHFARDALFAVQDSFVIAVREVCRELGG
jgi:hypothetical protein